MSSVSGMRESSSTSTVTCHVPSSACSSAVTPSASRPVISASSSRARAAISAPAERSWRRRFLSATAIPLLGFDVRPRLLHLLLQDLALDLGGLLLVDLAALALLLHLLDLLDARGGAQLLALGLLGHLLRNPDRETQRRRGQ